MLKFAEKVFSIKKTAAGAILLAGLLAVVGCKDDPEPPKETVAPKEAAPEPITDTVRSAWDHYHIHGVHIISAPVECVIQLKDDIVALIKEPQQEKLDKSREQLTKCQQLYQQTTVFVAANKDTREELQRIHQRIGLPLEMPGFIDAISQYPFSGIVNDTSLELNKEALIRQHGLTDISEVSLGFSVINFLLWGEHLYNDAIEPRPVSDFETMTQWSEQEQQIGLAELDIKEHPNNRRRRYLELAILILQEDLNQLASTWNKNTLPPLNQTAAKKLEELIKQQLEALLAEAVPERTIEAVLPLFMPGQPRDDGTQQSTLIDWFELKDQDALKKLSNDEAPAANKIAILKKLLAAAT